MREGCTPVMKSCTSTIGRCVLAGILLLACTGAHAALLVDAAWVMPTPDRASTTAYMSITSSEAAVLREARSTVATSVVIRSAATGARTYPRLALPAGVPVLLAPDAFHLVLRGLAHPLNPGDRVPMVLTIELTSGALQEYTVNAEVRARAPTADARPVRKY
jgi:periplasmic copper chaperone A